MRSTRGDDGTVSARALRGSVDGRPTGEPLADVDGRLAVDEVLALEQRHVVGGPDGDDGLAARTAPAPRARPGCRQGRRSRSRAAARASRSSAQSAQPNAPGRATEHRRHEPQHARPPGARARRRPRSGRGAASTCASIELPDGIGLSSRPFVRATSSSPPVGARKKPPCSGSSKSSTASRASRRASSQPAHLAGRDVELEQPVRDVRVVVEEALAAHLSLAPRAREAAVLARERPEQELPDAARRLEPVGPLEPARRLRRAPRARGRSTRRAPCRRGPAGAGAHAPRAAARAAPATSSPRMIERPCSNGWSSSGRHALLLRPREGQPLDAVRVGVLRRRETTVRQAQLAHARSRASPRRPSRYRGSPVTTQACRYAEASSALS